MVSFMPLRDISSLAIKTTNVKTMKNERIHNSLDHQEEEANGSISINPETSAIVWIAVKTVKLIVILSFQRFLLDVQ